MILKSSMIFSIITFLFSVMSWLWYSMIYVLLQSSIRQYSLMQKDYLESYLEHKNSVCAWCSLSISTPLAPYRFSVEDQPSLITNSLPSSFTDMLIQCFYMLSITWNITWNGTKVLKIRINSVAMDALVSIDVGMTHGIMKTMLLKLALKTDQFQFMKMWIHFYWMLSLVLFWWLDHWNMCIVNYGELTGEDSAWN